MSCNPSHQSQTMNKTDLFKCEAVLPFNYINSEAFKYEKIGRVGRGEQKYNFK